MQFVCIAGMHRSGTSLVSRMVNVLGVDLGPEDRMIRAAPENPKGFWENADIKRVNEDLLQRMGGSWHNPPMLAAGWECSSYLDDLRQKAARIMGRIAGDQPFGWKDPRNSLTLPFWQTVVNADKVVVVIRDPRHVANSLITRNGFSPEKAQYLWIRYTIGAILASRHPLILRYEDVLGSPLAATRALVDYLGLPEPTDALRTAAADVSDADLNRSAQEGIPQESVTVASSLYELLSAGVVEQLRPLLRTVAQGPVYAEALKELADREQARADELEGRLAARDGEVTNLRSRLKAEQGRADDLEGRLGTREGEVDSLQTRLEAEQARAEAEEASARELAVRTAELEKGIADLKRSHSWRITRPLRTVSGWTKWIIRRHIRRDRLPGKGRKHSANRPRATQDRTEHKRQHGAKHRSLEGTEKRESETSAYQVEECLVNRTLTVAVVAWDVCHNPLGRAYLVAEALSRYFNVVLLGPSFPRFGGHVWEPLEDASVPVVPIPGDDFPQFMDTVDEVTSRLQADAIVACKLRLPSLLLGHLTKNKHNRPLFIDIDDYELAFAGSDRPLQLSEVAEQPETEWRAPDSDSWTRYAEHLVRGADGLFVANEELKKLYGGIEVPHARDEGVFDPERYDRDAIRERLGLKADDRVVLFAGTPRAHKGVGELLSAVEAVDDERVRLLIVGQADAQIQHQLELIGHHRVVQLGNRPVAELPGYLSCADAVVLAQDLAQSVSHYQLPAKLVDALAFGLPVLATPTPPVMPLIDAGLVEKTSPDTLREDLVGALFNEDSAWRRKRRREYFLAHFSYRAVARTMAEAVFNALEQPTDPASNVLEVRDAARSVARSKATEQEVPSGDMDVVLVWKQHDMFLYGRRPEMLLKYLAKRPEVRRVAVVEPPLSRQELWRWSAAGIRQQNRAAYVEWMRKSWGIYDTQKIRSFTFTYGSTHGVGSDDDGGWPDLEEYGPALGDFFLEQGIDSEAATFIVCPRNEWIPEIVERFSPSTVIADVVDDHRTWPGVTTERVERLNDHYRQVCKLSDFVIVNCEAVAESMAQFHNDVRLLANAVDLDVQQPRSTGRRFKEMKALEGPVIGYVGNLEKKLDSELLRFVATSRPDWNLVLVGSAHANPDILELDDLPNVHFPGVVPYEEVKHWVREFDVAMMPHNDMALTRHMNPLKLYVYLGLGVPVVSTPVSNIPAEFAGFVSVAADGSEFVEQISAQLERGASAMRLSIDNKIKENSWERRVETLVSWIKSTDALTESAR